MPSDGIEPATSSLLVTRSTIELRGRGFEPLLKFTRMCANYIWVVSRSDLATSHPISLRVVGKIERLIYTSITPFETFKAFCICFLVFQQKC